jgi:hypothetical protein
LATVSIALGGSTLAGVAGFDGRKASVSGHLSIVACERCARSVGSGGRSRQAIGINRIGSSAISIIEIDSHRGIKRVIGPGRELLALTVGELADAINVGLIASVECLVAGIHRASISVRAAGIVEAIASAGVDGTLPSGFVAVIFPASKIVSARPSATSNNHEV